MFVYEEEEVCTLFDILLEVVFVFMRQKSAISVSEKRLQDRLNQDHPRYGFCGNEFLGHSSYQTNKDPFFFWIQIYILVSK